MFDLISREEWCVITLSYILGSEIAYCTYKYVCMYHLLRHLHCEHNHPLYHLFTKQLMMTLHLLTLAF